MAGAATGIVCAGRGRGASFLEHDGGVEHSTRGIRCAARPVLSAVGVGDCVDAAGASSQCAPGVHQFSSPDDATKRWRGTPSNHALRAPHLALCVGKKMRKSTGFGRGKALGGIISAALFARRIMAARASARAAVTAAISQSPPRRATSDPAHGAISEQVVDVVIVTGETTRQCCSTSNPSSS